MLYCIVLPSQASSEVVWCIFITCYFTTVAFAVRACYSSNFTLAPAITFDILHMKLLSKSEHTYKDIGICSVQMHSPNGRVATAFP